MAEELQTLLVRLDADVERLRRGMVEAGKVTDKASSKIEKAMQRANKSLASLGASLQGIGAKLSVGITAPLGALGVSFVKTASDAEELQSAFNQTFGAMADEMNNWAVATGDAMGRSTQEMQKAANTFGIFFNQAAKTREEAAKMSQTFSVLAQDLASFYNTDTQTAIDKLRSGLSGEAEPLRDFGVFLSAAAVEAKAMEMGLMGVGDELTEQEKILARYALILESTKNAQGDVARTSQSASNQWRSLTSAATELSVSLGNMLLPLATKLIAWAKDALAGFQSLGPATQQLILVLGGLAAALGPVLAALGFMATGLAALMSPIGLVLAALAGLTTAGIVFRDEIIAAFGAVADFVRNTWFRALDESLTWMKQKLSAFIEWYAENVARLLDFVGADEMAASLRGMAESVTDWGEETVTVYQDTFDRAARSASDFAARVKASMAEAQAAMNGAMGGGEAPATSSAPATGAGSLAAQAQDTAKKVEDSLGGAFDGVGDSIARTVSQGKLSLQSLGDLAKSIAQQITQDLLSSALGSLSGGGILGAIGSMFGGFRAAGGPVMAGTPYVVGEKGPELFVPNATGSIVPNHKLGGGNSIVINQTIAPNFAGNAATKQDVFQMGAVARQSAVAGVQDAMRRNRGWVR